jgi:hypothetical protein
VAVTLEADCIGAGDGRRLRVTDIEMAIFAQINQNITLQQSQVS